MAASVHERSPHIGVEATASAGAVRTSPGGRDAADSQRAGVMPSLPSSRRGLLRPILNALATTLGIWCAVVGLGEIVLGHARLGAGLLVLAAIGVIVPWREVQRGRGVRVGRSNGAMAAPAMVGLGRHRMRES